MQKIKFFFEGVGLLTATTVGVGIFALPYAFQKSGWLAGVFYLAIFSAVVIYAHWLYWKVLKELKEKYRLLGLVETYLGRNAFYLALAAIVVGLVIALTANLILAARFFPLVAAPIGGLRAVILFWLIASTPVVFKLPRVVALEFAGAIVMAVLVLFIFFQAGGRISFDGAPVFVPAYAFFPFGVVIYALSAWMAVETVYDFEKKRGLSGNSNLAIFVLGTLIAAFLYFIFVAGIFNSAAAITPDTVSGLLWPGWLLAIFGLFGLFAVWSPYMPVLLEVKNSLEKDLRWPNGASVAIAVFSPLLLVFFGLNNFLSVVSLVGGIFLGVQYVFILMVARKVLTLGSIQKLATSVLMLVFLFAAAYQIFHFVVK